MLKTTGKIVYLLFVFLFLTVLTQVGGIIYVLYRLFFRRWIRIEQRAKRYLVKILAFASLYLFISFLLLPPLAKQFGRVPLPFFKTDQLALKPATIFTCLSNRHYVKPQLKRAIEQSIKTVRQQIPDYEMVYLDANFPFWDGFPLLPHRSHDDGEKLDIAFVYQQANGSMTNGTPSWLGYGVCEEPEGQEINQPAICQKKGYWQYSLLQGLTSDKRKKHHRFDSSKTKIVLLALIKNPQIKKIFIEPHLKQRLKLEQYDKIRFHGCAAVRHDDHIHFQL